MQAPADAHQQNHHAPNPRDIAPAPLHLQAGLSYNEVARALKIFKSAVGKYVSLARAAGVDWALAQTLTDEELEARLYRPALPRSS